MGEQLALHVEKNGSKIPSSNLSQKVNSRWIHDEMWKTKLLKRFRENTGDCSQGRMVCLKLP